ncbi:WUSCHEL-related homeobox 11 [Acorus calamus]|uniref:WUSCHEL-related homeobox 11 n=1 Tax=Acorus calamus TaxID=4465 RepID=A0AAV9CWA6_ACOCL|nr:WUSCHEL-related homeobox 11 [Acorus calamus]
MEDPNNPTTQTPDRSSEPVRSRWTPKPEQILILESIFNSGMVNPPKDETVRIRKLLEKFGSVGDANVFYWFQNRRSRSRRRQRQIQAAAAATNSSATNVSAVVESTTYAVNQPVMVDGGGCGGFDCYGSSTYNHEMVGMNYSSLGADDLFSISRQMGLGEMDRSSSVASAMSSVVEASPSCSVNLQQQPGFITVFINGVPSEVPRGPIDMRALFGRDVLLVHSSGEIVPTNENGVIMQSLLLGESYFLVSKPG